MAETVTGQAGESVTTRRWMIILISAAVAFYWGSLYFYVPTLPVYTQDRINDLSQVGVVLSMYGLWQAVVRLPLGIIVDWIGRRKPFILLGFALSALGAWLMASATGYSALVIGRAMTGLAAAAWVPLTVLFSSQFPAAEAVRATSILTLVNGVARMFATGSNGTLNEIGGYGLAFTVAAGAAGLAILVTLPVREVPRAPRRPSLRDTGLLIIRPDVLLPALLSAVGQYVTWTTTFSFLPILARGLGATDGLQSLLVTLNLAISLAGNLLTTAIARRVGNTRLLYAAYVMFIGGTIILASAQSLFTVILAQVVLGLGNGIGYPLCMGMSIEKVEDSQRTTAMGLHQAVYAIGMFAGPWLSGILADTIQIQPMFWVTAVACLVLSAVLIQALQAKSA